MGPVPALPARYELLRPLGSGGAGDLLLVRDRERKGEVCALKILRPRVPDPGLEPLFRSEFLLLSELKHESIVAVRDFGVLHGGEPYFSMEFVPGEDCRAFVREDRLAATEYLDLARGLLEALAQIHARGVLHRDVKPANVIVRRGDGRLLPVLVDFGLAVAAVAARPREAAGTLPYVAPEVLAGAAPDPRSDLYSLGVLLFEVATGKPIAGRNELLRSPRQALAPDRIRRVLRRTRRATVPRGLDDFIARLVDPSLTTRCASAVEALEMLTEGGEGRSTAPAVVPVRPSALGEAPLVGRARAFEALLQRLDALREGHLLEPVAVVAGPAGYGVTRLLSTLRNHAAAADCVACSGASLHELAHDVAAHPRVDGTRPMAGEDPAALVFRIDAMLHALPDSAAPVLILDEVDRWDDRACAALRDWIGAVERRRGRARLLLALGGRLDQDGPGSELLRTAGRAVPLELRELGPLSVQDVRAALAGITGRGRIPGDLVQTLARASDGSPRLLSELLHLLAAHGVLAYEEGQPVLRPEKLAGVELPRGVEAAARSRAERLGPEARAALELLAAVDGAVPWMVAREVWGDAIDDLVRYSFVVRDRGRVRFPNEIARRAHDILRGARRAAALRSIGETLADEAPALAARVLWNAGQRDRARAVAVPLARAWIESGDSGEAIALLEEVRGDGSDTPTETALLRALLRQGRAAEAVPIGRLLVAHEDDEDVLFEYCAALQRSGRSDEALQLLQERLESAPATERWRYENARANALMNLGEQEQALEATHAAEQAAGSLFAHGGVIARVRANLLRTIGRRGAALDIESRLIVTKELPPAVVRAALMNRAILHSDAGHLARAIRDARAALALSREMGSVVGEGRACHQLAQDLLAVGRSARAAACAERAVASLQQAGLESLVVLALLVQADAFLQLGRPADMEALLERVEGLPGSREQGYALRAAQRLRALAAASAGNPTDAQELAREVLAAAADSGERDPWAAVTEAQVLREADARERELAWRRALRQTWRTRLGGLLPEIRVELAEAVAAQGAWKRALQMLQRDRSRLAEWKTPMRARALVLKATAALRDAQPAAAGRFAEEAIAVANRCDPVLLRARVYEAVASLLEEPAMQRFLRKPTGPASAQLLEVARDAWTSHGNEAMLRRIDLHLSELPRSAADPLSGPDADRLVKILHITREMNREFDRDTLLGLILDRAIELTGAERGFVLLLDDGREVVHLARNIDRESISEPERKISSQITRDVIHTGRIVRSEDAEADERFEESFSVRQLRLKSIIAVPFRSKGRTIGLLYLDNRFRTAHFDEAEERLLELFADQAVAAIEKAELIGELEGKRTEIERLYADQKRRIAAQSEALDLAGDELARHRSDRGWSLDRIVASSVLMQGVLRDARRVASSNVPVLLIGESGTGKGLLARALHFAGPREPKPFLALSCSGLGAARLEADLFGHVRGALGGEDRDRPGLLEQAHGGTLLLQEVGELPPAIQARLVGVLDDGEVRRVGETQPRLVDVRLMASSTQDLGELIRNGRFRDDLYLKIGGVALHLPPLRDRREDIEPLAVRFLEEAARDAGREPLRFSGEAMARLESLAWPGNVRELRTVVLRAVALCEGVELELEHIQTDARSFASLPGLDPALADRTLEEIARRGIELNRRQQNGLMVALTHGKLEFGEYRRRFSVSKSTTARDLDQLMAEELLEKRGKTRAVVYLPGPRLKEAARRVGAI